MKMISVEPIKECENLDEFGGFCECEEIVRERMMT